MNKFLSRKFIIASVFTLAGCTGFLLKLLSGGEFVTLALGISGLFGASDVAINAIHKNAPDENPLGI